MPHRGIRRLEEKGIIRAIRMCFFFFLLTESRVCSKCRRDQPVFLLCRFRPNFCASQRIENVGWDRLGARVFLQYDKLTGRSVRSSWKHWVGVPSDYCHWNFCTHQIAITQCVKLLTDALSHIIFQVLEWYVYICFATDRLLSLVSVSKAAAGRPWRGELPKNCLQALQTQQCLITLGLRLSLSPLHTQRMNILTMMLARSASRRVPLGHSLRGCLRDHCKGI